MYPSNQEVRDELSALCTASGVKIEDSTTTMLYGVSDSPRSSLETLRELLRTTIFRERSANTGDQEAYVTVLDAIDRTVTIKIRRSP